MSFSWDDMYERRQKMAAEIQARLGLSWSFAVKETFDALDLDVQMLADQPMWRVPYYVIAQVMTAEARPRRVIDHAWWLITDDRTKEPWGFVTEPYLDASVAKDLAERLAPRFERWGVEVWTLPAAQSAWVPGGTVPIIVTAGVGCLAEFLYYGVAAALSALAPDEYPDSRSLLLG